MMTLAKSYLPLTDGERKFAIDFLHLMKNQLTSCRNRYVETRRDTIVIEAMHWIWLSQSIWSEHRYDRLHPVIMYCECVLDQKDFECWQSVKRLIRFFTVQYCGSHNDLAGCDVSLIDDDIDMADNGYKD